MPKMVRLHPLQTNASQLPSSPPKRQYKMTDFFDARKEHPKEQREDEQQRIVAIPQANATGTSMEDAIAISSQSTESSMSQEDSSEQSQANNALSPESTRQSRRIKDRREKGIFLSTAELFDYNIPRPSFSPSRAPIDPSAIIDLSTDNTVVTEPKPYSLEEFLKMLESFEVNQGATIDAIESGSMVRAANRNVAKIDNSNQHKAQYGRFLEEAMHKLMINVMGLEAAKCSEKCFLDIGHGIGTSCLQAAYTFGCRAKGIEVVGDRNLIAERIKEDLAGQDKILRERDGIEHLVGEVTFVHGSLDDIRHRDFLTKDVDVVFFNNYNGVFGERSMEREVAFYLDDYVAGLFALMASGTILVTLHQLRLGPSLSEANTARKNQGLSEDMRASFFNMEKIDIGEAGETVKWTQRSSNKNMISVYKYTRLKQNTHDDQAVILCANPKCDKAVRGESMPATKLTEDSKVVMNACDCGWTPKSLRRRPKKRKLSF